MSLAGGRSDMPLEVKGMVTGQIHTPVLKTRDYTAMAQADVQIVQISSGLSLGLALLDPEWGLAHTLERAIVSDKPCSLL